MSGDFAERLAAVDDAIADASDDEGGDGYGVDGVGEEHGVDGADGRNGVGGAGRRTEVAGVDGGNGSEGGVRDAGSGTAVSESVAGDSMACESVMEESRAGESVVGESVAADVVALEDRVAELEAAVQALRGYAGSVRAVNDRVEERADAAVATAEDCRERVGALERRVESAADGRSRTPGAGDGAAGSAERVAGRERAGAQERPSEVSDGSEVPWPPAEPRSPYGEVDADDDREQPGLLARLRDAL